VDLVAAGQAFHWFDPKAARAEFLRVLKPGGRVALVWNLRRRTGTPFLETYERLLGERRTNDGGDRPDRVPFPILQHPLARPRPRHQRPWRSPIGSSPRS
jgi:SAM-dependent methyltransferase